MITSSFIILENISTIKEQNIYKQGIFTWNDFLNTKQIKGISNKRKYYYNRKLQEAKVALAKRDTSYFINKLPQAEMWRLYNTFKHNAVFLDIEITGVNKHDDITMIGLYDGVDTKIMFAHNFNEQELKQELSKYSIIVTYNGATHDIPYLKKRYKDLIPNIPIIDIKTSAQRLGYKGGLKKIEKEFKIKRSKIIDNFHGGDPKRLYRMYKATGDDYYLNLLIEYNEDDIVNLKIITEKLINSTLI